MHTLEYLSFSFLFTLIKVYDTISLLSYRWLPMLNPSYGYLLFEG